MRQVLSKLENDLIRIVFNELITFSREYKVKTNVKNTSHKLRVKVYNVEMK
jgi:hypothetical protein